MKTVKKLTALFTAMFMLLATACADSSDNNSKETKKDNAQTQTASETAGEKTGKDESNAAVPAEDSQGGLSSSGSSNGSSGEIGTYEMLSNVNVCSQCEEAAKYLKGINKAYSHIKSTAEDKSLYAEVADDALKTYKDLIRHDCSAEVKYVKDIPYVMGHYSGMYTGEWKGAGPCGKGTFTGYDPINTIGGLNSYTYIGEWKYGLPNGTGEAYADQDFGGNYTYYHGEMVDGKRCGKGSMCQQISYFNRYYSETLWENDNLAVETDVAEFNKDSGELITYGKMIASGSYVDFTERKKAMSKQELKELGIGIAGTVLACMIISPLIDEVLPDSSSLLSTPEEQLAALDEWRKYKEKEAEQEAERQEEAAKAAKDNAYYNMRRLEQSGQTDTNEYKGYEDTYNMYS